MSSIQNNYLPNFCGTNQTITSIYDRFGSCPYLEFYPLAFPLTPFFSDPEKINEHEFQQLIAHEIDIVTSLSLLILNPRQAIVSMFDPRGSVVKRSWGLALEGKKYSDYSKDLNQLYYEKNIFLWSLNQVLLVLGEGMRIFDFYILKDYNIFSLATTLQLLFLKSKDTFNTKKIDDSFLKFIQRFLIPKQKEISWLIGQFSTNYFAQKIWSKAKETLIHNRLDAFLYRALPMYILSAISETFTTLMYYEKSLDFLAENNKKLPMIWFKKFNEETLKKKSL